MKRNWPKCKCGANVGLYFSERLGRHVCPPCLEAEFISPKATKPWEVDIEVWGSKADRRWWWEMRRVRDKDGPSVVARNTKPRKSRGAATAEARRVMRRLRLVEKAK